MARKSPDIPNNMLRVYRRFEQWRSAHTGRLPIPRRLWAAAVELAREHVVFHTAKALHLEYGKLKRLAGAVARSRVAKDSVARPRRARSPAPPAFVELMTSAAAGLSECLIELEGRRGKMRIRLCHTKACPPCGDTGPRD